MYQRMCCSHCTDCPVLARAAGSSTVPTGITQSINPEQLGSLAVRSACRRPATVGSCGRHGYGTVTRGCGDRTAGALHVHVWSCPAACAPYACIWWTLWAVQLTRSAQSARHMRCCGPAVASCYKSRVVSPRIKEIGYRIAVSPGFKPTRALFAKGQKC